ncbi:hypothetical protein N9R51_00595 [Candidatus Pelagibacter sp.]|nr:hypothetical protein [Candidatus Pelagibacter sp.]
MALTKAQLVDMNANELILDLDADTSLHASTDDQIDIKIGGADDFRFTANTFTALAGSTITGPTIVGSTSVQTPLIEFTDGDDAMTIADGGVVTFAQAPVFPDGSLALVDLDIDGATDIGAAVVDADLFIIDDGANGTNRKVTAARVKTYMGAEGGAFSVDNLDIDGSTDIGAAIVDADLFIIDDGAGGTNRKTAASRLKTYIGGDAGGFPLTALDIDGGTDIGAAIVDADLLIIDDGAGGTNRKTAASRLLTYAMTGTLSEAAQTNITSLGTLSTLTIDNVIINGATIGHTSDTDLITVADGALTVAGTIGSGAITSTSTVTTTGLIIGSTAVTSTATELNLLDGVSGLVQADLTKLAAIDATATELNLIDGGATVGTTAIADGDGLIVNDAGTMRVSTVQTLAAYLDDEITAMPNLVTTAATTVGALDSGSITSGFGAIDNGTSNIRSATITAETAFVPDAANGATLGTASLEFADMYLHDGGIVYFGADQDVELAHVADVGLTLKTATTSDDTKATLTLQTGDTDIAVNDVLGQLHFQAPDEGAGTDAILVAAGIAAISEGDFSASNNATKLSFQTGASEAASEKMSLSSVGLLTIADDLIIKNAGTIGTAADSDLLTMGNAILTVAGEVSMTTLDIGGTNVTSTATELNQLDGVVAKTAGKETIWVPSNAMTPTTSNGAARSTVETTSGRPDMEVLDFDKDSDEFAQFSVAFPKSWNAGTVTFQFFWSGIAATTGVELTLAGVAFADNDSIDTAYGTAVAVADAAQGAVEEMLVSAESGAITIAGSPGANEVSYFRIGRDVSEDNMAGDCRLHGIKLHFTTNAANDA